MGSPIRMSESIGLLLALLTKNHTQCSLALSTEACTIWRMFVTNGFAVQQYIRENANPGYSVANL